MAEASSSASSSSSSSVAPNTQPSALIIGGGIAGLTCALFLQRAGISARVFEAYPKLSEVIGGLGLAPNGLNVLRSLGLAEKLAAVASPTTAFEFRNSGGSSLGVMQMHGKQRYGVEGVACTRLALHKILHEAIVDRGVDISYGRKLKSIAQSANQVTATFEDGSTASASMLIGADGLHSITRQILFPSAPAPERVGLLGFGGAVPPALLTPELRKLLPAPGCMSFTFGPLGFFGASDFGLDAQGNTMAGWWSNTPDDDRVWDRKELARMTHNEIRERLLALHGDWAEPVPSLIRLGCADDAPLKVTALQIFDVQDLKQWHSGRVCLIGDAAHAMSPNSGQGASQALEDAMYLSVLLKAAGVAASNANSLWRIFTVFQAERKPRCDRINAAARARGQTKRTPTGPWMCMLRDWGMRAVFAVMNLLGKHNDEEYGYRVPGYDMI